MTGRLDKVHQMAHHFTSLLGTLTSHKAGEGTRRRNPNSNGSSARRTCS